MYQNVLGDLSPGTPRAKCSLVGALATGVGQVGVAPVETIRLMHVEPSCSDSRLGLIFVTEWRHQASFSSALLYFPSTLYSGPAR